MILGSLLITSEQTLIFQVYLQIKLSTMLPHRAPSYVVTNTHKVRASLLYNCTVWW
jgi:hypothetical protein